MSKRDDSLYLNDIKTSILKIQKCVKGLSFDEFNKKDIFVDAVIRNLEVIGEASIHISSDLRKKHKDIPWQMMADMRNKMIHEYFGIDNKIIWETIKNDFPPLKKQIFSLLKIKN